MLAEIESAFREQLLSSPFGRNYFQTRKFPVVGTNVTACTMVYPRNLQILDQSDNIRRSGGLSSPPRIIKRFPGPGHLLNLDVTHLHCCQWRHCLGKSLSRSYLLTWCILYIPSRAGVVRAVVNYIIVFFFGNALRAEKQGCYILHAYLSSARFGQFQSLRLKK